MFVLWMFGNWGVWVFDLRAHHALCRNMLTDVIMHKVSSK